GGAGRLPTVGHLDTDASVHDRVAILVQWQRLPVLVGPLATALSVVVPRWLDRVRRQCVFGHRRRWRKTECALRVGAGDAIDVETAARLEVAHRRLRRRPVDTVDAD